MGRHHMGAAVQPISPNFSADYSGRNGLGLGKASEHKAAPTMSEKSQPDQPNPSIARSMSRYRRNRPPTNGSTAAPALPRHANVHPTASLPSNTKQTLAMEEDHVRERHRQNAMEQLTGGNRPDRTIPSRAAGLEKDPAWKEPVREEPQESQAHSTTQARGERRADSNPTESKRKSFLQKVRLAKTKEAAEQDEPAPRYIGVGGGGIVPGTDAPVSAVNAGERHVRVRYGDTAMDLVITPATRVQDLLLDASQHLSPDIDPEKYILLESFRQVGLERPLRRYEHVRDVMNSWTHDAASYLIIIPPSSMEALARLDAKQVPTEQPSGTTVHLYHSQRPRKWDKRYVTLQSDGQVTIAKKENGKDHTNICHLSDFDIYSPCARALARDINPPKRICFAIKSQQKSSMFLSTENFVHFFATNDRSVADKWYRAVQEWRSWYMVTKLGAGQAVESEGLLPKRSSTQKKVTQRPHKLSHEDHTVDRLMGTEPLVTLRASADQNRPSGSKELFSRKKAMREHVPPPTSSSKVLTVDTAAATPSTDNGPLVQGISAEEIDSATFSPRGLLGRTYTQRRNAMREREDREKRAKQDPFSAQGLVGGSQVYSPSAAQNHQSNNISTVANGADTASLLGRTQSVSQKNKPLVDLTPVFQEPPQHTRKGRGVTVDAGVPLIEGATGPDLAPGSVAIPPATAWRRPSMEVAAQTRSRTNTMRSVRHPSQPPKSSGSNSAGASPSSPNVPFIPNSLLASSARVSGSQGQAVKGHGVATGDRTATRPMLDMASEDPFAEGSLLRKL